MPLSRIIKISNLGQKLAELHHLKLLIKNLKQARNFIISQSILKLEKDKKMAKKMNSDIDLTIARAEILISRIKKN